MGAWYLKMYTYHSSRGIPGAIVNNVWRRGERQADHNTFFQGHFQKSIGRKFSTQWMAKYAYYQTHYVNKDTTQLRVDNTYRQQEFYITTSNVYEILPDWSVSLSYDFKWNKLDADMMQFVYPHRFSNFLSVATAIDFKRLKLQASLLGTFVKDHLRKADDPKAIHTLSPSLFVNVYPFNTKDFSLRAFAKKSFRMPTFNDLYYSEIGNALLNPEKAWQYNIGCVYERSWKSQFWKRLHIQLDTYYNTVHDKIIAYPKGQQFRWTMLNLGRVHIKGIDVESELTASPLKDLTMTARLQYTYQQAQDVTSPSTSYYRAQIPYIPWHSGSLTMSIEWKRWNVNYSFIYAGERYNQQDNTVFNYMQPWYTNDLSANYQFLWQHIPCRITLEVNNIFSQDYEVILNYPMPKRNYVISFDIRI
jgi:outer membrane receptor protein involved in Fe transport